MNKETRTLIEDRMLREIQALPQEDWSIQLGTYIIRNLRQDTASSSSFRCSHISFKPEIGREALIMSLKDGTERTLLMPILSGLSGVAYMQIHNFLIRLADVLEGLQPDDIANMSHKASSALLQDAAIRRNYRLEARNA